LLGQGKGILGDVTLDGAPLCGWQAVSLPIDTWTAAQLEAACQAGPPASGAGFATATLTVHSPADAFLAFPGFGKGFVWVGETLLGRYWEIGPQRTLYVPGPLLRAGTNTITVLELDRLGDRIELRAAPDLGEPEEYVETF
jgi:beta-galactosidase